ncbi:PEPxxWA-CTERM sorting domain-containing protein, partial [Klebsiella pneumoniae]|nr:PEPxxWA-CTERM sorting domain-containing protein [Klebsiella pneumoniae]
LAIFDAMGWDLRLDILQYPGFAWNSAQILDAYFGNGGIPEPTTWAMMIGGFGLVGGALRRRRSVQVTYA